jgi:myo-inositol-1-phosphate synthase
MAPHAEVGLGFSNGNGATHTNKDLFTVNSPNVVYTDNEIRSKYSYRTTLVNETADGKFVATPKETVYDFKVDRYYC